MCTYIYIYIYIGFVAGFGRDSMSALGFGLGLYEQKFSSIHRGGYSSNHREPHKAQQGAAKTCAPRVGHDEGNTTNPPNTSGM